MAASLGAGAVFVRLDVTDAPAWAATVDACTASFGNPTVLVNNAGVLGADPGPGWRRGRVPADPRREPRRRLPRHAGRRRGDDRRRRWFHRQRLLGRRLARRRRDAGLQRVEVRPARTHRSRPRSSSPGSDPGQLRPPRRRRDRHARHGRRGGFADRPIRARPRPTRSRTSSCSWRPTIVFSTGSEFVADGGSTVRPMTSNAAVHPRIPATRRPETANERSEVRPHPYAPGESASLSSRTPKFRSKRGE